MICNRQYQTVSPTIISESSESRRHARRRQKAAHPFGRLRGQAGRRHECTPVTVDSPGVSRDSPMIGRAWCPRAAKIGRVVPMGEVVAVNVSPGREPPVHGHSAAGRAAVDVSDTTEIRWFASGAPPLRVLRWFTRSETMATVEERSDIYRVDGRPDVGVKWRHRTTLELKARRSVGPSLSLAPGLAGHTESWRKWSPADGLARENRPEDRLIDVHKKVMRHVLAPLGEAGAAGAGGCQVEITQVRLAGFEGWSLAFATFGTGELDRELIVAAWEALNDQAPAPSSLVTSLEVCAGYPAWLSQIVIGGDAT